MKRETKAQAPRPGGDPFARRRTRLEEAEESELGEQIRARDEELDVEDEAGDTGYSATSEEP